jgi:hypothetical protein
MVINPSLFRPSASVSPILAAPSPTTTAAAPLSCAARILCAKSQPPRSTNAILYGRAGRWNRMGGHAGETHAKSG